MSPSVKTADTEYTREQAERRSQTLQLSIRSGGRMAFQSRVDPRAAEPQSYHDGGDGYLRVVSEAR